ncbi:MAG: hypothetical protein ACLT76_09780 [Clostridium fessum]
MEAGKERILELLELAQEFGRRFRAKKKEKMWWIFMIWNILRWRF